MLLQRGNAAWLTVGSVAKVSSSSPDLLVRAATEYVLAANGATHQCCFAGATPPSRCFHAEYAATISCAAAIDVFKVAKRRSGWSGYS